MAKTKLVKLLGSLSMNIYDELGALNFDERDFQIALGYELNLKGVEYLRETHIELFYKDVPEVVLLHASWEEEVALYILVEIPGVEEPRLYILPWSREEAERFQQAIEEGEEKDEEVKIGNPFFNADEEDRERLIYTSTAKPMAQNVREQILFTNYDQEP